MKKVYSIFIAFALLLSLISPTILAVDIGEEEWVDVRSGWGFYTQFKKGASYFRFTEEEFDIEFQENQYIIDRPVVIDFNGRRATYLGEGKLFEVKDSLTIYGEGEIIADNATTAVIGVNGGELFIEDDVTITNATGRAIYVTNGSMTMNGGKLINNTSDNGGAIFIDKLGTVTINNCEISGNIAEECGGGIYVAPQGTLIFNGGLINGNTANAVHPAGGYGGGGIYTAGDFIMTGGTVSDNAAVENGGGITTDVRDWSHCGSTNITGGQIIDNVAGREGGGIYFGWHGTIAGSIGNPTIIADNCANTSFDWGGGGIMIQTGVTVNMTNTVVTENIANGFGGGVAGCPSGEVQVFTINGAAIFNNTANGVGLTQREESDHKTDDQIAAGSELFTENGYQDFYCENNSVVYGDFLGGGNANWEGSCDTGLVKISDGCYAQAEDRMGLTANPSEEDIANAMDIAEVIIKGNYSDTHGGGIMCNGIIVLGEEVPGTLIEPEEPREEDPDLPPEDNSEENKEEQTETPEENEDTNSEDNQTENEDNSNGEPQEEVPEEKPVIAYEEIEDEDVPLVELPEEAIPLDNLPETGDNTSIYAFACFLSGLGLIALGNKSRKIFDK